MLSNNYAYVNGEFVPAARASVSIYDTGFLFGDGVFETMPVYSGNIFRFERHVRRLFNGLEQIGIGAPFSAAALQEIFQRIFEGSMVDGVARVFVTRGPGVKVLSTKDASQPTVVAIAWPHVDAPPKQLRAMISSIRIDCESPLIRIKSANRLPYVLAKKQAELAGMDEAVLLNQHGRVAEMTGYNIFTINKGRLLTPPVSEGALSGITREAVLQLSERLGISCSEIPLKPADMADAEEVFATNSVREIVPVVGLSRVNAGSRVITERLQVRYRQLVRDELGIA